VILFIAMAIATVSILVVGTLAAADIIRFGPRDTAPDHPLRERSST
jgi:hypothetical protein